MRYGVRAGIFTTRLLVHGSDLTVTWRTARSFFATGCAFGSGVMRSDESLIVMCDGANAPHAAARESVTVA